MAQTQLHEQDYKRAAADKNQDENTKKTLSILKELNKQEKIYDYLGVMNNPQLNKYFLSRGREKLKFSDSVVKINRKEKHQKRWLVLTNKAMYNFPRKNFKNVKRKIFLKDLKSVFLSHSSSEFVFQVVNSYDYRFKITRRAEVLDVVYKYHKQSAGKELKIYFSEEQLLKEVTITRTDRNREKKRSSSRRRVHKVLNGTSKKKRNERSKSTGEFDSVSRSRQSLHYSRRAGSDKSMAGAQRGKQTIGSKSMLTERRSQSHQPETKAEQKGNQEQKSKVDPISQGWLTKRKGKANKWELKFFRMAEDSVEYMSARIKGTIQLLDTQAFVRVSSAFPRFQIHISGGELKQNVRLSAESEEVANNWVRQIELASKKSVSSKNTPQFQGFLDKQSKDPNKTQVWKNRYFVLRKNRCWYYEMTTKGSILLSKGVGAHSANVIEPTLQPVNSFAGISSTTRYSYKFNVSDASRIFYLAADSEADMLGWIKSIREAGMRHVRMTKALDDGNQNYVRALNEAFPDEIVTFVFTDVQSSTSLWETVPDAMNDALEKHDDLLRKYLKICKGYEVKTEGDAFMCAFFTVLDAVMWCVVTQKYLLDVDWPEDLLTLDAAKTEHDTSNNKKIFSGLRIRMGIHTGKPNPKRNPITGRMDYFGPCVNLSARVSDAGHGGQIVLTAPVYNTVIEHQKKDTPMKKSGVALEELLLEDLGEYSLKGIKTSVPIFSVVHPDLVGRQFPPLRAPKHGVGKAPAMARQESLLGAKIHDDDEDSADDDEDEAQVVTSRDDQHLSAMDYIADNYDIQTPPPSESKVPESSTHLMPLAVRAAIRSHRRASSGEVKSYVFVPPTPPTSPTKLRSQRKRHSVTLPIRKSSEDESPPRGSPGSGIFMPTISGHHSREQSWSNDCKDGMLDIPVQMSNERPSIPAPLNMEQLAEIPTPPPNANGTTLRDMIRKSIVGKPPSPPSKHKRNKPIDFRAGSATTSPSRSAITPPPASVPSPSRTPRRTTPHTPRSKPPPSPILTAELNSVPSTRSRAQANSNSLNIPADNSTLAQKLAEIEQMHVLNLGPAHHLGRSHHSPPSSTQTTPKFRPNSKLQEVPFPPLILDMTVEHIERQRGQDFFSDQRFRSRSENTPPPDIRTGRERNKSPTPRRSKSKRRNLNRKRIMKLLSRPSKPRKHRSSSLGSFGEFTSL